MENNHKKKHITNACLAFSIFANKKTYHICMQKFSTFAIYVQQHNIPSDLTNKTCKNKMYTYLIFILMWYEYILYM